MSPQPSSQQQVQDQQAAQAGLTAVLLAAMAKAWPLVDLADLKRSLPQYEAAVASLVFTYGRASATLGTRFYQQQRAVAGIPGRFPVTPADPASIEQVAKSIEWATKGLWSAEPDLAAVKSLTNGVAQKLVMQPSRNTLIDAIERDTKCRGWARVARPDGCSFCALLSTRGAVYKTEQSASVTKSGTAYHDHCHCLPVPVFADHYEPPAHVREWQRIYQDAPYGKNAAQARNNFRVALAEHRARQYASEPVPSNT
jgi:hypothetical protein